MVDPAEASPILPINYVERLRNIREQKKGVHVGLGPVGDDDWAPIDWSLLTRMNKAQATCKKGTYHMADRNLRIYKQGKGLTQTQVNEEVREFLSKVRTDSLGTLLQPS